MLLLFIFNIYSITAMELESAHIKENPVSSSINNQLSDFIFVKKGNSPIILTAPHGGKLSVEGVPERKQGEKLRDVYTYELTLAISKALYNITGAYPYVVAAGISRKYIDANRPAKKAYEDERVKSIYDSYHSYIKQFIIELKKQFQNPLLLDIHGQGSDNEIIFRGTQNKMTVTSLLTKYNHEGLLGSSSIIGILAAQGYKMFPPVSEIQQKEHTSFDGGFTVRTYGSHTKNGIDAIQLEFGWNFRTLENINTTAKDLATAIATFYKEYQK